MPESLVCTNLTKRYGRGRPVINGFTHTFEPGTATALAGPNGSGKTTLIRLLTTLAFPSDGEVRYGNLPIHQKPLAYLRSVGYVDDSGDLPPHLSAVELLEWVARERGTYSAIGRSGIDEALDALLLDERRNTLLGSYSSGMTKKVQIAAALIGQPRILVLDEPFRALDAETRRAAETLVGNFVDRGGIVILASHHQDIVERLCRSVVDLTPR